MWSTIDFLSPLERSQERLDAIADHGGIVGVMYAGSMLH